MNDINFSLVLCVKLNIKFHRYISIIKLNNNIKKLNLNLKESMIMVEIKRIEKEFVEIPSRWFESKKN